MPEFWVVNASPLIGLGKIIHLELLMKLPDGVVVPSDVAEEIKAGPEGDAARTSPKGRYLCSESRFPLPSTMAEMEPRCWRLPRNWSCPISVSIAG